MENPKEQDKEGGFQEMISNMASMALHPLPPFHRNSTPSNKAQDCPDS